MYLFTRNQHEIPQQTVQLTEPVGDLVCSLKLCKAHAKLPLEEDFTDDDETLNIYEAAAELLVETHSETRLKQRTFSLQLQELPKPDSRRCYKSVIRLETAPVVSVEAVKYIDCHDSVHTLAPADYKVYLNTLPPTVVVDQCVFTEGINTDLTDAIQVEYTAGTETNDDGETNCNPIAKQAILFLVALFVQKKEPVHLWAGKTAFELPLTYQTCIDAIRWRF